LARFLSILFLSLVAGACQSNIPANFDIDRDCATKKIGSRFLAKATGVGLGLAGVPASGIVGRGVSMATDPRCQALQPKAMEAGKKQR
jgi:hypothetical protein